MDTNLGDVMKSHTFPVATPYGTEAGAQTPRYTSDETRYRA
jgi:hypothetical protein